MFLPYISVNLKYNNNYKNNNCLITHVNVIPKYYIFFCSKFIDKPKTIQIPRKISTFK